MKAIPTFDKYKKRLRNIKQYKDLSEEEFEKIAQTLYDKKYNSNIESKENNFIKNEIGIFLNQEEAIEAQEKFKLYAEKNNITNLSDINLLYTLIQNEVQEKRIRKAILEATSMATSKGKSYTPNNSLKTLNELTKQTLELRKSLGLAEDRKTADPLEYINQIKRKFKIWRHEKGNHAYRYRECPECGKELALIINLDYYEVYKHPFYKNKILCNEHLWNLYKEGKITKIDIAKILFGIADIKTTLYCDWLERRVYSIPENKDPLLEDKQESGDNPLV